MTTPTSCTFSWPAANRNVFMTYATTYILFKTRPCIAACKTYQDTTLQWKWITPYFFFYFCNNICNLSFPFTMFNVISLSRPIGSSIAFRWHLHSAGLLISGVVLTEKTISQYKQPNQHQLIIIALNYNAGSPHDCALRVLQSKSLYIYIYIRPSLQSRVVTQTFALLFEEHNYTDAVYLVRLTLLHVSTVQISHHQVVLVINQLDIQILCVLDRASSWYLNK